MRRLPTHGARVSRARGFTLFEMLVSLVIVAMISGLLWQVMQQVMRVELLLQSSGAEAQANLVRREWLRGLIEAALPEQRSLESAQFKGDGRSVALASAETLDVPGFGAGQVMLQLVHHAGQQRNELLVKGVNGAEAAAFERPATRLLTWPGPAAGIRYLDEHGQWLDRWPSPAPAGGLPLQRPPQAVLIELGEAVGGPLLVAVTSTEPARSRRIDWERQ